MKTEICNECAYKSYIIESSKSSYQKRGICTLTHRTLRSMDRCPEEYNIDDYNALLAKCEKYDEWAAEQEEKMTSIVH